MLLVKDKAPARSTGPEIRGFFIQSCALVTALTIKQLPVTLLCALKIRWISTLWSELTECGGIRNWDTINIMGTQTLQKDDLAFFPRVLLLLQAEL